MVLSHRNCGAVILAGGRSRRMGRTKALLPLAGTTLIAHLAGELSAFDELLVSANDPALAAGLSAKVVADAYFDCGPLAGLHAALTAAEHDALLCVPCDLPLFTAQAADCLLRNFPEGADAMTCVDSRGGIHPLCGIYTKAALPAIEQHLKERRLKLRDLLTRLNCSDFHTAGHFSDSVLMNVNTIEDYSHIPPELRGELT